MEILRTPLDGCVEIRPPVRADDRGAFVKPFHRETFAANGLPVEWAEVFWSTSRRGVVRGFHFQRPPDDHAKLVFCVHGEVHDVALDLRRGSSSYGRTASVTLSRVAGNGLLIPAGFGHAFQALTDDATLVYLVTSVHSPENDAGVRWDSAGLDWPLPVTGVSPRDAALPRLDTLTTPFGERS